MLKRTVLLVALFALAISARSQSVDSKFTVGLFGGYLLNQHTADFKAIPDCPSCSPGYRDGSGNGLSFGGLLEYKISSWFSLSARLSYNDISAILKSTEATKVIIAGVLTDGAFEHTMDANLSTAGIEPTAKIGFYDNFNLNLGMFLGTLVSKKYAQKEEIVQPAGTGTFADAGGVDTRSRTRNVFSGEFIKPASFMMSPFVGLSYNLPLNKSKNLTLEPEAYYYWGLSNIVNSEQVLKWKANYLRLGLAVKYTIPRSIEIIKQYQKIQQFDTVQIKKDMLAESYISQGVETLRTEEKLEENVLTITETTSRADTMFVPRIYELTADIKAVGVDDKGNEMPNPKIVVEEFISNKLKPMLNYVFFDENSSDIPAKYKKLDKPNADKFKVNDLYSFETLDIYYQILNIIGRRLTDNPDSKLRLVGCNADMGSEKGNKDLSIKRAENVKDYLIKIWNIPESRLTVEGRNLPDKESTPITDIDKAEENRRVEFYSDDYKILSPVFLADTLRTSNPPIVRFFPEVKSEAGVKSWSLDVQQDLNKENFKKEGTDLPPNTIDWQVTGVYSLTPRNQMPVNYKIKVKDAMGKEIETPFKSLPFELVTIQKKRDLAIKDKQIENFSLILFDFDKSDISGGNNKIVEFIKQRIKDGSTITIEGYSDETGEDDYNKKLSEKRAKSAKNSIGKGEATVIGIGEDKLLYDNNLPEGRFYCRTVDIKIETEVGK